MESLKIVSSIISTNVIQNDIYTLLNCFQNIPTSQILFNIELIQRFIDLTASVLTPQEVKSQAICCLGLYCKFHDVTAIFILNQGIIDLFWSMVIENDISGVLEKISWFFAILAAVQIPKNIVSVHYQHIVRYFY